MKSRLLICLLCICMLIAAFALPAGALAEEAVTVEETTAVESETTAFTEETTEETETPAAPVTAEEDASVQTLSLIVPEASFMDGMTMKIGARGDNVQALVTALYRWEQKTDGITKYLTEYARAQKALWYNKINVAQPEEALLRSIAKKQGYIAEFGEAVIEYKQAQSGTDAARESFNSDVDTATWKSLGLGVKDTFEDVFKTYSGEWAGGGLSPIKMKLEGNTLTFDYSPKFYITRTYEDYTLTDEQVDAIIEECVEGLKEWEGTYDIYGHELKIVVDVHPSITSYKLLANIKVVPDDGLATMVFGSIFWRPGSPFLGMRIKTDDALSYWFDYTTMHEFGHVLGLFDAYGYGTHTDGVTFLGIDLTGLGDKYLPEAPRDRAPYGCIMRSGWYVTDTEAEMLLYAWQEKRLQLFIPNILTYLGAAESQAFYY